MSYYSAKQIEIKDVFSWWFVDNTPDSSLSDKYSPYLRNARLDWMAIINRPGHSLFATLTAWDYPRGIWSYLRTVSTNDRLIVRHNTDWTHKLYTITEAWVATSITTWANIASDNKMTFQNIEDVIYCMNWSDYFWKLSWTTYTVPNTWVANFAPSFSVVFNWSHWASGWSTNWNVVYKSVWDNYEDFNSAGADTFTFEETITSLAVNSQALFYFTKNTISITWVWDIQDIWWAISYTTRALQVKEWAVNFASTISAWNNIYAITPSNKIIQIARGSNFDWFEVFELSERPYKWISKIMNTLDSDQSECFGYFLPKDNLIKWFFKTKNATFNDICIIYDITKDAFLVDNNKFFYGGIDFKGKNYTISMIEPKVYQDEYWQDDEDQSINFRYETKDFDLQMPTRKKELWEERTYTAINSLAELEQCIYIDWNEIDCKTIDKDNIPITTGWLWTWAVWTFPIWTGWWFTWEDNMYNVDIIRTKWNLQVKGKKIKIIFTNNTVWGRIRLENIEMLVEILPWIQNNLTI